MGATAWAGVTLIDFSSLSKVKELNNSVSIFCSMPGMLTSGQSTSVSCWEMIDLLIIVVIACLSRPSILKFN